MADILCAKIAPKNNSDVVEVTLKAEYSLKKAVSAGKGTDRKSGSGVANKYQLSFFTHFRSRLNMTPHCLRKIVNQLLPYEILIKMSHWSSPLVTISFFLMRS